MTAQDYERLAVQAIAGVEMDAAERAELMRLCDATCDEEDEAVTEHESDAPGWRDYAGALVFAVLVVVAWCWACVLGSAS